jgi:SAM-dependent methyltransferase
MISTFPIPPLKFREIVGPTDEAAFDNPEKTRVWGDLAIGPLAPGEAYERVLDFGCGCGRNARQLFLQEQPPLRYVGIDIHREMIEWCQQNLKPAGIEVRFAHHDVWSRTYAPNNSRNSYLPIGRYGRDFSLINAHSVFTHLYEEQTRYYLKELRGMLAANGIFRSTWFFFNRAWFPVLAPFQHTIFVNEIDPTQAVYYDWAFFKSLIEESGFKIVDVKWSIQPGFQNTIYLAWGEQFEAVSSIEPPDSILGFGRSAPPATA